MQECVTFTLSNVLFKTVYSHVTIFFFDGFLQRRQNDRNIEPGKISCLSQFFPKCPTYSLIRASSSKYSKFRKI